MAGLLACAVCCAGGQAVAVPAGQASPAVARTSGHVLTERVEQARAALYKARTDAAMQELQERLRRELAGDPALTEADLAKERQRIQELFGKLHRGPVRTYPARRTVQVWERIAQAIADAIRDRQTERR